MLHVSHFDLKMMFQKNFLPIRRYPHLNTLVVRL
jgi:hypothetical protein